MYFADLTPCSYNIPEPKGISVGWLDKAHYFSRGAVPIGFVERLVELCKRPVVRHRGFHACELCGFEFDINFKQHRAAGALSNAVIRVVGSNGSVYHSPAMICHYVAKHGYQPPEDFIRAVMETDLTMWPNKSPEPTAVGACSSAIAVHVARRRWLSFFR
jgi:hypothetical protein